MPDKPWGTSVPCLLTIGSVPGQQWKRLLAALTAGVILETIAIAIVAHSS